MCAFRAAANPHVILLLKILHGWILAEFRRQWTEKKRSPASSGAGDRRFIASEVMRIAMVWQKGNLYDSLPWFECHHLVLHSLLFLSLSVDGNKIISYQLDCFPSSVIRYFHLQMEWWSIFFYSGHFSCCFLTLGECSASLCTGNAGSWIADSFIHRWTWSSWSVSVSFFNLSIRQQAFGCKRNRKCWTKCETKISGPLVCHPPSAPPFPPSSAAAVHYNKKRKVTMRCTFAKQIFRFFHSWLALTFLLSFAVA